MNANDWPDKLKPDALLIITHSQHLAEAAQEGVLSDIWNLGDSLRAVGWNQELENSWLQRLDPTQAPCVKGERVVSVCGTEDKVTPMRTALAQMDAWQVPQENRFAYKRGHFSIPLGLINNNDALLKFSSIINNI